MNAPIKPRFYAHSILSYPDVFLSVMVPLLTHHNLKDFQDFIYRKLVIASMQAINIKIEVGYGRNDPAYIQELFNVIKDNYYKRNPDLDSNYMTIKLYPM